MREGYKKTELGEIPENWRISTIEGTFNFIKTKSLSRAQLTYEEAGDYYIHYGDIHATFTFPIVDTEKCKLPMVKNDVILNGDIEYLKEGDLIIADASEDLDGVGECIELKGVLDKKIIGGLHTIVLRDSKGTTANGFRTYLLSSPIVLPLIKKIATGASVLGISKGNLKSIKLVLPPLPEQQKIASILSTVDEKIEVIDQQISETQQLKKGLMQRLLTKGIGHTKFKDSALGEIPESWEVKNGEEISVKITKGASPKWQGFDYQNQGLLFVTSENVRDGKLDISKPKFLPFEFNEKVKNSTLQNGDILINIVGASIGRSCLYHSDYNIANINQAICLLRIEKAILSTYILYYLQGEDTVNRLLGTQNGSARQNLSLTDIKKFKFVIPSMEEQQKIASILSTVDEKLDVLADKKNHNQELKKGLMQQLLMGKIRVNL